MNKLKFIKGKALPFAALMSAMLFVPSTGMLSARAAVQSVQQQYTTATHVGLIFTLEPVFSATVAFFLAGERLLPRAYLGAVLMLLSLVLMEIDWPPKKERA